MTIFLWILVALAVFFSAVCFHELGHFLAARASKMRVEEFWIGIPPRAALLWKDKKGTTYTLNWLPIGGFVRLCGEDPSDPEAKRPDSFSSRPYLFRSMVLLAGVAFNFLLAFFVFVFLFWNGVAPLAINTKFETATETRLVPNFERSVEIGMVRVSGIELSPISGSASERAGVRSGDVVLSVGSAKVGTPDEFVSKVRSATAENGPVALSVSRSWAVLDFEIHPENGKIGAYVSYAGVEINRDFQYRYGFFQAVSVAADETLSQTAFTFELLGRLFQKLVFPVREEDRKEAAEAVGGPIAVGGLFVDLVGAKVPASVILAVAALLSINLGAFNLLPLPALDGGRFFLMTLAEPFLRWGKIATIRKIENSIHSAGFAAFILLAITIAFHDVSKFFR